MKTLSRLFVITVLVASLLSPSIASANTQTQCVVDGFTRIEQQFVLATFGTGAAKHFTSTDKMKDEVASLSADQVRSCTDEIPPISGSITKVLLAATVAVSLGLAGIIIYSALANAGLGAMSETNGGGNFKQKLPQAGLVAIAIAGAMPWGLLFSEHSDDADIDMSRYYSPLNHLLFKGLGSASEVANRIDSLFVSPTQAVMPTYIIPEPAFLALRESEIDDNGYEENAMSHLLNYASCLVSEVDEGELNNVIDAAHIEDSEAMMRLELGNPNNGCYFASSMSRNQYTVGQIASLLDDLEVERFKAAELELFKSGVLSAVQQAINFKQAQYKSIGRPYFIKDKDLKVNLAADWWETCPVDLSELATSNDDFNISSLIANDRHAELCLSKQLVSKFYAQDFEYKGKRVSYQPAPSGSSFFDAARNACLIDGSSSQTGLFDCAVAMELLATDEHQSYINELGWAVKPLNVTTLLKQVSAPVEPQQSLAKWQFESSVYESDSAAFNANSRAIRTRFAEATNNTDAGRVELRDLLTDEQSDSVFTDILSIVDVKTCLTTPNQLIYADDGTVKQVCGSPLNTLRNLGDTMIKTYVLMQAGHYAKGVMNKMGDKAKKTKKPKTDGKLSDKKSSSGVMTALASVAGVGVMGLLSSGIFSADVALEPFGSAANDSFMLLGGTTAFIVGAALTEGMISISSWLLLSGLFLKYGMPLLFVFPFYLALIKILLSAMQLTMQLVIVVLQPLIESKNLAEKYLSLTSRVALLALSLSCLPLFFYLSVISTELVLPVVLSTVGGLVDNATSTTGSVSAIIFSVLIFSLLYIAFVIVLFYKAIDVQKTGWEIAKSIFNDAGAARLDDNTNQAKTGELGSVAKEIRKK